MNKSVMLIYAFVTLASTVFSQTKSILYYDANGKGVESKKQCHYYREVSFDNNKKPIGEVRDYLKSGKLQSIAEGSLHIDKLNDNNSVWTGHVTMFDKKGKKVSEMEFSSFGDLHGKAIQFDDKEQPLIIKEYDNGLPIYNWYTKYIKGSPVKYSFLNHLPLNNLTEDRVIYPMEYRKDIYNDGTRVQYYTDNGVTIAVMFTKENLYGKYYSAYITLENGSDEEVILNPMDFLAVSAKKGQAKKEEIIPYEKYMKKVKRKQGWSSFFNAFAESQAASQAGYSANVSNTSAMAVNNSGGAAVGYSETKSASYSGSAQYNANQQARQNQQNFENNQYEIRNSISQGYLKLNTVLPKTRIIGYVNVKESKIDEFLLNIPINGKVYQFSW